MNNKGFFQVLVVLVTLACLYHLSFTFIARSVENDAAEYAQGDPVLERAYLDSVSEDKVLGLVSYRYAKQREINLGLDLKGGMNVTLEVSIADLLKAMANNSEDPTFVKALQSANEKAKNSDKDYVTLFVESVKEIDPNASLASARMFGHKDQDMIKYNMTNEQVVEILRRESEAAIDRTFEVLNSRIDKFGVTQPNIQKLEGSGRIMVELPGIKDPSRAEKLLQATAKLEFWETYDMRKLLDPLQKINDYLVKYNKGENAAVDSSTVTAVTDSTTVAPAETPASPATENANAEEKADTGNSELSMKEREELIKNNPLFSILEIAYAVNPQTNQKEYVEGPLIGYVMIKDTSKFNAYLRLPGVKALLPADAKILYGNKPVEGAPAMQVYGIQVKRRDKKAPLEGDVITDASFQKNKDGAGFMVEMKMNAEGAEKWAKITEANIGKSIAIVLDDVVYSAPNVMDKISGGISSITGNFDYEEAKALSSVLKAGKLPAPARIVEKAVVGPSLGAESIRAGILSMVIALIIVLIYMAFYYNKAGLIANVALFSNIVFLVGSLAALNTTLTLPGIAGIVLTFGMSVDANVLIFERIREELLDGKGLRLAISDGYQRAYSSIIDANVTTILTALILMVFGAGPVKGFAVVLFVGILTSLFSAIFITRLIFEWQITAKKAISFSTKMTEGAFSKVNIDFLSKRKVFYTISLIIILGGAVSFFTKGFNLGVDLKGGRSYTISFDNSNFTTQDIANSMQGQFGEAPIVKLFGSNDKIKIITKYKFEDSSPEVEAELQQKLYEGTKKFFTTDPGFDNFKDENSGIGLSSSEKVGPTVAGDTKRQSIYAIIFSIIVMFLYIMLRFRGWQFGIAATAALAHDVLITLAFFSIFDGIFPFSMEIDQSIIAAILTVIGYSINDTVVVFDRVREYFINHKRGSTLSLLNTALNSTISRTFNTSLTTLVVLLVIFIFGGPSIKAMSFALLVGIGVGTYSSLCIASPLVYDLGKRSTEDSEAK
jgi:SecD/SecF fusion protein